MADQDVSEVPMKKALIVTANEDFQGRLEDLLKREGWDFTVISDPDSVLDTLGGGQWSIIFLDTLLPRTNGFDLCRRIKSSPSGSGIPVYLFGGRVLDGREEIIKLWGCTDFLSKTTEDDVLVAILRDIFPQSEDSVAAGVESILSPPAEVEPLQARPDSSFIGSLEQRDVLEVFYDLYARKWTGTLTLRREEVEKAVSFDQGRPLFAMTNVREDTLGEWLVRIERLTDVEMTDAREAAEREGQRLEHVLVAMGLVKGEELRSLVQRHMEEIIFSLFEWTHGEYMLSRMDIVKGEDILLEKSAGNVIMEGIRRRFTLDRLKKSLGSPQRILTLSPTPPVSIQDLRLSPSEARLVDLIDGKRTTEEIISQSNLTPLNASRVFFCLLTLRIVEDAGEEPEPESGGLPLDTVFGLDPVALLELDREAVSPSAVSLLRFIDGHRSLLRVLEESTLNKSEAAEAVRELLDKGLLRILSAPPGESRPAAVRAEAQGPGEIFPEEAHARPGGPRQGMSLRTILAVSLPPLLVLVLLSGGLMYVKRQTPGTRETGHTTPVPSSPGTEQAGGQSSTAEFPRPHPAPEHSPAQIPEPQQLAVSHEENTEEVPQVRPKEDPLDRLRRAVKRRPDSPDALIALGVALRDSGEHIESIMYLRKAVGLSPQNAKAHYALGRAYRALGDKEKAVGEFKEALKVDPTGPFANRSISQIFELKK